MNDFREYKGYCEATYGDIMHFGILGMHWGIRRYQNPDGTLTAAGKKRYDKYMKKAEAEDKVVEVFKDEKPKLGSYNNVGYNAKVVASKKAEKFRKKAEKYGTEYKEEVKEDTKTKKEFDYDEWVEKETQKTIKQADEVLKVKDEPEKYDTGEVPKNIKWQDNGYGDGSEAHMKIKRSDGKDTEVTIDTVEEKLSKNEEDFLKNFASNDLKIRKQIADKMINSSKDFWSDTLQNAFEDRDVSEAKEYFTKVLGTWGPEWSRPGESPKVWINAYDGDINEISYDCGFCFGDHLCVAELDSKGNVIRVSLEG